LKTEEAGDDLEVILDAVVDFFENGSFFGQRLGQGFFRLFTFGDINDNSFDVGLIVRTIHLGPHLGDKGSPIFFQQIEFDACYKPIVQELIIKLLPLLRIRIGNSGTEGHEFFEGFVVEDF
jgi:hypothetical protein